MTRSVPEWVGRTDDTQVPPRVRLRVLRVHASLCHICEQPVLPSDVWECDHKKRLADGGANAESNLRPVHVRCHKRKTAEENRRGAKADRIAKKHHGIKTKQSRPMMGTKASGWRKRMDGTAERR